MSCPGSEDAKANNLKDYSSDFDDHRQLNSPTDQREDNVKGDNRSLHRCKFAFCSCNGGAHCLGKKFTLRILHECSCFIEFIIRVGEKR